MTEQFIIFADGNEVPRARTREGRFVVYETFSAAREKAEEYVRSNPGKSYTILRTYAQVRSKAAPVEVEYMTAPPYCYNGTKEEMSKW